MQAVVYEIWWKPERKVYFIADGYDEICKEVDDPLKLEGFFPCPCPVNATMTNSTTIPVPDYAESQDQYAQIDDLTKRIDILTSACKVIGVYDTQRPKPEAGIRGGQSSPTLSRSIAGPCLLKREG